MKFDRDKESIEEEWKHNQRGRNMNRKIMVNDLEWLLSQVEGYRDHLWGTTIIEYGDCLHFRLEKIKENIEKINKNI